jgi:TonB-linked SusC/RagA family outer membrane protein
MKKKSKSKCAPPRSMLKTVLCLKLLTLFVIVSMASFAAGGNKAPMQNTLPPTSEQQKKDISGYVKDNHGVPLLGVTVVVKGSTIGTNTNNDGYFNLSVPVNANSIIFSFVGMKTKEVSIAGQSTFNIILEEETTSLDDIVVIGYGVVRKSDLTGSVGIASVKDMAKAPVVSFAESLAGRVAGMQVNQTDGQPGASVNIVIRGNGSLTQSSTPLYVIDGFPVENPDPKTLNPEEIESMTILKDASSTAIYGSRGANGVILIQTKRGKEGSAVVSFSSSLGFQSTPKKMKLMSPYEYIKYQYELTPSTSGIAAFFLDGKTLNDYKDAVGLDMQDYLFRSGMTQMYDIAMRGGSKSTRYSVSGSYSTQKGTIVNTGLERYSGRITVDQNISKTFTAGITTNYSSVQQQGQIINEGQISNSNPTSFVLSQAWGYRPISADPRDNLLNDGFDDDAITVNDVRINPYLSQINMYSFNTTRLFDANAYVNCQITKDLSFKTTAGIWNNTITSENFYNSKTAQGNKYYPGNVNGVWGTIKNVVVQNYNISNTLNFKKTINSIHNITGLALFELGGSSTHADGYGGKLLPNESLGINGLEEGIAFNPVYSSGKNTIVSYALRGDYSYNSKYVMTLTYRADGSSKFPHKWGYFPSVAFAWNMHHEDFFSKAFPWVSTSKLRFGYGSSGNNRIGNFDYFPTLTFDTSSNAYSFNNGTPDGGIYISNVGNADLKWETINTTDIGFEFGILKDRITVEAEVYRKVTKDLLLNASLPPTTGYSSAVKNIGELKNEGIEFSLNTINIDTKSFRWQTSFNISFNRNTVVELTRGQQSLTSAVSYVSQFNQPLYIAEIGKPSGMMIGYVWEGNYQYDDFDKPSPNTYVLKPNVAGNGSVRSSIQPGDIKYKDLNGDLTITNADMTIIGRGQPIHIGGISNNFSYKGFDLNVFFQWSYGNNVYNANRLLLEGNSNKYLLYNQFASYANRWTPENQTNENYRTGGQGPIGFHSSRVVEDGSFIRLKTVNLAYSIPTKLIKKAYLSNLSLSISAQNLITWTNYSGLDPEVSTRGNLLTPGYDFSSYPKSPTVLFGIKASF